MDKKTGRTLRVWIPRESVEAYARKRGRPLAVVTDPPFAGPRRGAARPPTENYWREIAEELSRQNLELQVRLRELEAALAERGSE